MSLVLIKWCPITDSNRGLLITKQVLSLSANRANTGGTCRNRTYQSLIKSQVPNADRSTSRKLFSTLFQKPTSPENGGTVRDRTWILSLMRGVLFPTQPQYRWLCASVSNRIPLAYRASAYPFSLRTSNWGGRRASISHLPGSHPGALPIELRPPLRLLYSVIGVYPTFRKPGV